MSREDDLNDLFDIEVHEIVSREEEDSSTRDADLLHSLPVASPCDACWADMEGDDLVRFCRHCRLNVYDLSAMTRHEAAGFVREVEGRLCVRFYQRLDGTVLTDNCPVGWRAARRRLLKCAGTVAATALGLLGVLPPLLMGPPIMGAMASHPSASYYTEEGAALHRAACEGDRAAARAILARGVDINVRDQDGRTALWWAAEAADSVMVQFLLTRGAEVDAADYEGGTALMEAAEKSRSSVIVLLAHGANVNAKTRADAELRTTSTTALQIARLMNRVDIVRVLKKAGAKE